MAGTTTPSITAKNRATETYRWTFIADASNAAIASKNSAVKISGRITDWRWIPGTPNPTASCVVTLKSANGVDALGGAATGLNASTPSNGVPLSGGSPWPTRVDSVLTFASTGNAVNSAQGYFEIDVERD